MDPARLLEPIPGPDPAGVNLAYTTVYNEIREAREEDDPRIRTTDGTKPKKADWGQVVKLATHALTKQTKDLQLAVWLTEAWLKKEGLPGLSAGLGLLRGLIDGFWDGLYPEAEEGNFEYRAVPLQWMGLKTDVHSQGSYLDVAVKSLVVDAAGHTFLDYSASRLIPTEEEANTDEAQSRIRQQAVTDGKLTPEEFKSAFRSTPADFYRGLARSLHDALAELDSLQAVCDTRFEGLEEEDRLDFAGLREALEEIEPVVRKLLEEKSPDDPILRTAEAAETPSYTTDVAESVASPGGAPARGPAPTVVSLDPTSREDAAARIAAVARFLRAENRADPGPYLVLRGLRWGELRAGGPAVDPRLLDAPDRDTKTRLKGLLLDARWEELIEAGEEVMATSLGRGWLDLQRYVVTACDGIGGDFANVATAIRGSLRTLLQELPDLPGMTLMDDSPVANPETLAWLRDNGLLEAEAAEGVAEETARAPRHRARSARDPYDIALERLRGGHADKAVELLMREAYQETSERARFLRRAQAANIMVKADLETVALPVLLELAQLIERHNLEEWEAGETVAQPLDLLYRCMRKLDIDDGTRQELYNRVCRLDPSRAIQFAADRHGELSE